MKYWELSTSFHQNFAQKGLKLMKIGFIILNSKIKEKLYMSQSILLKLFIFTNGKMLFLSRRECQNEVFGTFTAKMF